MLVSILSITAFLFSTPATNQIHFFHSYLSSHSVPNTKDMSNHVEDIVKFTREAMTDNLHTATNLQEGLKELTKSDYNEAGDTSKKSKSSRYLETSLSILIPIISRSMRRKMLTRYGR